MVHKILFPDHTQLFPEARFLSSQAAWRLHLATWHSGWDRGLCWTNSELNLLQTDMTHKYIQCLLSCFFNSIVSIVYMYLFIYLFHRFLQRPQSLTLRAQERRCTNWGKVKPLWPRMSTLKWSRSWRRECDTQTKHSILLCVLQTVLLDPFTKASCINDLCNIFLSFQWIPGCVQENCASARSFPAEIVLSPHFEQRQKLPDFLRIWPGCEFLIMLTSFPELSVEKERK